MKYIPITARKQNAPFKISKVMIEEISRAGEEIEDGDVLVVASKYVAMAEGRFMELSNVKVGSKGKTLARKFIIQENLAELVAKESQQILGGIKGFALCVKDGVLTPNAGIDKSNIFPGYVILHPKNPFAKARIMKKEILELTGKRVGIIIADSRLMPLRLGTIGVAIGVAGIEPVRDERGRTDLFGKKLIVTRRAIADDISAGAQLLMGEADEATPIVIVRTNGGFFQRTERNLSKKDLAVAPRRCLYLNSLKSD